MLISNIYSVLFLIVSVKEYSFDPLLPFRQKDTLVQKAAAAAAAVTFVYAGNGGVSGKWRSMTEQRAVGGIAGYTGEFRPNFNFFLAILIIIWIFSQYQKSKLALAATLHAPNIPRNRY